MTKKDYIKAVEDLLNGYDAYYFINKHDDLKNNTHKNQFELLINLLKDDGMSMRAINWIKNCYDCYYKKQYENDEESPFSYLKGSIDREFGVKVES